MTSHRTLLLATTMIAGVTFLSPTFASAQSTPPPPPSATPAASTQVEEVVVTGSRIKRNEYNSSQPITVLTSEKAGLQGLVDTSSILQQSSIAANAFQVNNEVTGFVTTGGPGAQTVSLRGFGATRTLVLLNGRRLGPSGVGGTVGPIDLQIVPQSIVDRVEILKDGASSIYGSDAVAGVVNFITKTKQDGVLLDVYGNKSFQGGGDKYRIDGSWGKTFDKGYVNVALDYTDQESLYRRQRKDLACAADYVFDPTTRERRDYLDYFTGQPKCFNLHNNYFTVQGFGGGFQFHDPAVNYPTVAQGNTQPFDGLGGGDYEREARTGSPLTFPYAHYDSPLYGNSTAISPSKLYSLAANGAFDLTAGTQAYGEMLLNRRDTSQTNARQLFPNIDAANPNNPFGGACTVNPGAFLPARSCAVPVIAIPYTFAQTVDYGRLVGGLRGGFGPNFLTGWNWDIYGSYSKSSAKYTKDEVYNDRIFAVAGPGSTCNNNPVTDNTVHPGNISGFNCSALPGGVPWFSSRVLQGNFTDAEKAFLFTKGTSHTDYTQAQVEATMTGDLFTLPAGPVGAALGASWRRDTINDQPDAVSANYNIWGLTSAGPTVGQDSVKEVFGELQVPLMKGAPMFESLDLTMSGRYTDYDSYGANSTYKVGLNWRIVPAFRIRGSVGTSFRAPALYEQFLNAQTAFAAQSADPCSTLSPNFNTHAIQVNCAAEGIPNNYNSAGASSIQVFASGGRATGDLKAETSNAKSIGFTWTPTFADLSVAVDYSDIVVNNEVTRYGSANILKQCYSQGHWDPVAGRMVGSPFCNLYTRAPGSHYILTTTDNYVNIANQTNRSLDFTARWRHDFGDLGAMTVETQATWILHDETTLLGGVTKNYNGTTFGYRGPDFAGNASVRWDYKDWTGFWNVQAIGKGSDAVPEGGDTGPLSKFTGTPAGTLTYFKEYIEMTAYHSFSLRKKFDTWTITAGVQNAFDERPPSQSTGQLRRGTAAIGNFDLIGRKGFIEITKRW